MDWLKTHYDKALLLAVSIAAIAVSVLLALKSFSLGDNFGFAEAEKKQELGATGVQLTERIFERFGTPIKWNSKDVGEGLAVTLFGSTPIVQLEGDKIVKMKSTESESIRERNGVSVANRWLFENDLEYERSDVLYKDPDGDGFDNFEEYVGKCDPQDASSHPEFHTQLFLKSQGKDDYILRFAAAIQPQFQVARIEPKPRRSWFKAVGEKFPDRGEDAGRFIVKEFLPKTDPQGRNISELLIEDTVRKDDNPFVLVRTVETNRPTFYANFVYKHKGMNEIAKKYIGDTFTLPQLEDRIFTVKDVKENYALITFKSPDGSGTEEVRIPLDK